MDIMRQIIITKSKKPNKNRGFSEKRRYVNREVMKSYLHLSISYLQLWYRFRLRRLGVCRLRRQDLQNWEQPIQRVNLNSSVDFGLARFCHKEQEKQKMSP